MNSLYLHELLVLVELDVWGHQDDAVVLGRMPPSDLLVERDPVHPGHSHIAEDGRRKDARLGDRVPLGHRSRHRPGSRPV